MPKSVDYLFDPKISPKNIAGNSKKVDDKARSHVMNTYEKYDSMRNITQGGLNYNVTERWDELYRLYMAIRDDSDHDYHGQARVFMPVIRRAINVIDSESSNALFTKDDYFSSVPIGDDPVNRDMAKRAYAVLKYYSDQEGYVDEYELAKKQCLIYGCTAGEITYWRENYTNLTRKRDVSKVVDEITGETTEDEEVKFPIYQVDTEVHHPQILARDIYRLYIDINSHDPEKQDMVYRDGISAQKLLELVDDGVYNAKAVDELLKMMPTGAINDGEHSSGGEGKTVIADNRGAADSELYEVMRFQGLFTEKDETGKILRREQYWIDLGERKQVLRIQKNPLLAKEKTFVLCNYDSMISEFYTDGVANPIKSLQYEINDKECQSLDGVGFDLNAPFEVLKSSGLDDVDIEDVYNTPHKALYVRERNSIQKLVANFNLSHLNMELTRLNSLVDNVTGATASVAGTTTGTQADRSGKALGILEGQGKSQFNRFIRKFERKFLQRSLQKLWRLIVQFSNDEVEIELLGEEKDEEGNIIETVTPFNQKVNEVIGQFNIRVSGGSEFLKEREYRDSMLELMSVVGMNDTFMQMLDPAPLLKEIAKSGPYDLSRFINPDNLYQKQKQQVDQLTQTLEQASEQLKMYGGEIKRLSGELSQTDRSNMISAPVSKGGQPPQQGGQQPQ